MSAQYQNVSFLYYDDVQGLTNPGIIYKAADKFQFWSGTGTTKLVFTTDNTNLSVEVANNELNTSVANVSNLTIDNNLNGQSFIRTVAIAKILGNGGNSKAVGCSVTRTNTGRYTCTISPARPDAQYVVQLTCMETSGTLDDVIIHVQDGTMASTGFSYYIHEQDNGGNPGAYRDRNNFITIFDTD